MAVNLESKINSGDWIDSFKNGKLVTQQVINLKDSFQSTGIKLTTISNKCITITKDQKMWASLPEYLTSGREGLTSVYLMFRYGFGFRVGITNKAYHSDHQKNISSRLIQERILLLQHFQIQYCN